MNSPISSNSIASVRFSSKGFHGGTLGQENATATESQEGLPGFEQDKLRNAWIEMVGMGGIGGSLLENFMRKGYGGVGVCDGDKAEIGNLGRQKFFPEDIGKNKAICGARNAIRHASWPAEILARPCWFEDAVRNGAVKRATAAVVGPDRDSTRVFASRYFYKMCPVIFVGIGAKAEHGYVFVQKPGSACFACLFPDAVTNQRRPCPGTPAMMDILLVTAGLVLTALDALLMKGRSISWNYWDIYPSGAVPTQPVTIERVKDCPLCGKLG